MELVQGKSLENVIKKHFFTKETSESDTINIIRSILSAIVYLTSKGIIHRDLKPDNILIGEVGKVKFVDFGFATSLHKNEHIFRKCGTPGYIAPEVFKYDQNNPTTSYNDKYDLFSVGCILFYM